MKKTKDIYRSAPHKAARRAAAKLVDTGAGFCSEPVCLMKSRWIRPGSDWDLSHDPSGTKYIGPSHSRCNRSEGAIRGNKARGKQHKRWKL